MSGGGSRRRAGPSWPSAFSRFFARSPPRQEAAAPGRPAGAHSSENKGSEAINLKSNQKESTTLPALLKVYPNEEKNHSTEELSRFDIPEELKKANSLPSLTPGNKAADKDKQPREGFFQFLGSLFNLATKSSLVDSKPSACQDEPNRCEKDLQNRNTLTEGTQQQYPKTEKPVCSTPRIKEDSVNKDDMIFNNIEKDNSQDEQGGRKRSADVKMQIQRKPQAPAVTYATYRGSARIRQLLKSQSEMTEKGEESTDNRNASVVKENGEIQTVVSPKSEHVTKENGEDEGKDHEDVIVNSSTVKMELKKSGEAQHYLDSNKHEITPNASASSTGSPSEVDLKHTPILEADKVKRTYSQESLLLSSRNSKIPTNSTHQIADALKMSAVDSSFGKEYVRLGEAECYFLMDKKAASNCEKEIQCSDHSYQESTEKMQDGCLQSPKSNDKINEELQLSKEEYCCNDQIDNHSQITSNVQMLHSNTILQQQADEHTGCANKDSDPRKSDAQKMVAAAEREQNPQNFLARVLLPVNEQTCTSLSVESRGEECVATGNLTASKLTVENDKDTVMDQVTCNEELNALRKPMHVRNEHQLNHVKNSKDTATPQPGCLEKMKVMSEVAVENFAHGLCTHGCENMKSNLDELTAPLSVSFESSLETDDCYSASLHPDYKSVNKNIVKREVGSKDKRDAVSTPDLECEKSKSLEPIDMSLSENSIPTSGTISHKTAQDIPERTLVTLVEDNIPKPAPCPLVSTERIDDSTLAASKISEASMNEMALAPFESKNCISELSSHISKSQEKKQEISHSALKCKGNPLTDHFSIISEKDIDVDIISASPPSCEDRHIHISSEVGYNNKHGISSTVLYSSSYSQGKVPSPAINSENDQVARWSVASRQDGYVFLTAESREIIPEDRMTKTPLCSEDLRASCPPVSLEPEFTPAVLHPFTAEVDVQDFCTPSPPSPTQESKEGSNLSIFALETSDIAQENCSSSGHTFGVEAEELSSAQQADDDVLAETMPSPVCPLKRASNSECTKVCKNAEQQVNLCDQTSGISEALSETDDQTAAAAAGSNDLYSEKIWKNTNGVGQDCTDLQDAVLLFKKAEEIVDSVLHLAVEEIIAKQAVGVCQVCGRKDGLINTDILNDQKTVQLEAEEIQSTVHSLKHFNESNREDLFSFAGNETYDTNNQDKTIPSYIPAKIDLHSVLALKAREIIDEVINSAKQKLTSHQWQVTESEKHSEKIEHKPEVGNPEILNLDGNLSSKTQELIEEPAANAETQNISINCEKAVCSGPLLSNSMENSVDCLQRNDEIPNNAFACQTNGFLSTGSLARLASAPLILGKEERDKKVFEHLAAAETCSKGGLSATSRNSDVSLHLVNRDAAVTEEVFLPLQLNDSCNNTDMPERVLLPSVNVNLSSFMPNEESISTQNEYKVKRSLQGSVESIVEANLDEHSGREAAEMFSHVNVALVLEDSKVVESKEELADGASELTLENAELNMPFTDSELPVTGEHNEGKNYFNSVYAQSKGNLKEVQMKDSDMQRNDQHEENDLDCSSDMKESTDLLGFSPLIEQWENGSFTIVYEGALQTENRSVSTDDIQTSSLSYSGLPLDSVGYLMCERAKNNNEPTCSYGKDNKLIKATEGHSSESFLSVEAKRCRIYPFSLSPIYEDDSSHEDLLSADTSPEGHPNGISKDNSDHASVLSLLQSVSERLQLSTQFSKEEDEEGMEDEDKSSYEGNALDVERGEECLSSQWTRNLTTTVPLNDQNAYPFLEQSPFLSKEQLDSKEQTEEFQDETSPGQTYCNPVSQKVDSALKQPPTSVYYQYLRSANNYSFEKGTRFGSILQDILQPKIRWSQDHAMPKLGELPVNLVDRASLTCNPRPGRIIIYDIHGGKSKQEIHSDVLDTTSWIFPIGALLRIIRGCWIFYEKPKFHGQKYVLEEGETVLDHLWDLPGVKHHRRNLTVGSIKHVTKDCSVPEIEFSPGAGTEGLPICIQSAVANLEELDVEKNPYIRVKSGIWLAYSDLNYKGEMKILEECNEPSEIPSADVRSLRPLKMGGLKVQMPMNVKIIIYEKTHFGGWSKEFSENISSVLALFGNEEDFQEIGSIRVIGGVWVAYDKERYKGRQYLLEEGDYEDTHTWGGADSVLLSFRFLQADFIESSVTLFQSNDEDEKTLDLVNEDIPDLEQTGFGPEIGSIVVKSGVWVAYQQKHFCGEQYVLEKGKYKCFFDWGGSSKIIMSIRPIKLEPLGTNEPPHLLKAFSNTHFQGACLDFTAEVSDFTSFIPCSFKVLRGCWLLYYQGEIDDNHCVLEEGLYIDLPSCGCPTAAVKSLKPIEYVFAEPSLSLFALECCKGRELHFSEPVNSVLNEDLHFYTQSVWVRSGLWIAYEGCNFLGKQILLEPSEIPNWNEHSGWKVIGSLRPVKQPGLPKEAKFTLPHRVFSPYLTQVTCQCHILPLCLSRVHQVTQPAVYLRIRNRAQGKYLTVAGSLADVRATSVCVSPYTSKDTQIWHYCRGLFKSKVNDACLDVIGGRDVPGAKVALWVEHGKERQKWRLNEDGTISSYLSEQLVLDIKGGNYYDKNHVIMNEPEEDKRSQKWDIEIL